MPQKLLDNEGLEFITYVLKRYPRQSVLIVLLLILSGFAEGLGIVTLLPLLELAVGTGGTADSELGQVVINGLAWFGLPPTLIVLLTLIVIGMTLKAAFLWLAMKRVGYTMAHVATDLRLLLMRALLQARWSYFVSQPAGYFGSAIGSEALRASSAYKQACALLATGVQVLIYTVLAFLVSWQVALLALVAGMVATVALGAFVRMSREAGKRQTELMKSLIVRLTDALQGIKPIKAMGRERHLWPLLEQETMELNTAQERSVLAAETQKLFQEPMLVLLLAIGLFVLLTVGDQPFTTVLVMTFLFYRLVGRVHLLQNNYLSMAVGESAFWSLQENVERAERERESTTGKRSAPPLRQGIVLDSVDFGYGDREVLRDLTLSIPAGQFVAIIGPSGAGKTTIADLIIGLYHPQGGKVYVDGVSLAEIDLDEWRQMIGYVPQEMFLFHDTLIRNVTLGDDSISSEAVEQALRTAGAWDFVSQLPDRMNTVLGERGSRLSGGQRQRIAIARALVRNPKLLVLDEVTTALDPVTEAEICETLRQLRGEVAVVSISHQPAMREAADIVYHLEHGTVTELHENPTLAAIQPG